MNDAVQTILTLKEIRVILAIAEYRNGAIAAKTLNMSQPVLSRALAKAEKKLGCQLFQRGWSGTETTSYGEVTVMECRKIISDIEYVERNELGNKAEPLRLLSRLRWHQMQALVATVETRSVSLAAEQLGISQPAASRSIKQLSDSICKPLFTRLSNGVEPCEEAIILTILWSRIEQRLKSLLLSLKSPSEEMVGRVSIGMLPFSGQRFVAKCFGQLSQEYPQLHLIAIPGSYQSLIDALRRREIDAIIGVLRDPAPGNDLLEIPLYQEKFTLIARKDHPCHRTKQSIKQLAELNWIVAPHGTPVRHFFESLFRDVGVIPPAQTCEILSFDHAEQMIVDSSSLALLTYNDLHLRTLRAELKSVDFPMQDAEVSIGLTYLAEEKNNRQLDFFLHYLKESITSGGLDFYEL